MGSTGRAPETNPNRPVSPVIYAGSPCIFLRVSVVIWGRFAFSLFRVFAFSSLPEGTEDEAVGDEMAGSGAAGARVCGTLPGGRAGAARPPPAARHGHHDRHSRRRAGRGPLPRL